MTLRRAEESRTAANAIAAVCLRNRRRLGVAQSLSNAARRRAARFNQDCDFGGEGT